MSEVTYEIVEHDGGWAYKVGPTFSETFPTHDEALAGCAPGSRRATRRWFTPKASATRTGREPGTTKSPQGGDRPETSVEDDHDPTFFQACGPRTPPL